MLGWIGWAMVFFGMFLIGNRNIKGFYYFIGASGLLILDAIMYEHWSLVGSQVMFTCLNVWNIIKWRKRNDTTT